jgi:hypothetical protein
MYFWVQSLDSTIQDLGTLGEFRDIDYRDP